MSADPDVSAGRDALLRAWTSRYRAALVSYFRRRMVQTSEAEDLAQEVFLKLSHREDLADIRDVDRYLFQAAAHVLVDWRRRGGARGQGRHDPLSDDLQDVGFPTERVIMARDRLRAVIDALQALPQRTQTIFALYHFDQRTQGEIARELGVALRTVEDHLARANRHLADVQDD